MAELMNPASRNGPAAVGLTATVTIRRVPADIVRSAQPNEITGELPPASLRQPLPFKASRTSARRVDVPERPISPLRRTPLAAFGPLLRTVIVYVRRFPTATGSGRSRPLSQRLAIRRCCAAPTELARTSTTKAITRRRRLTLWT